ncbi:inter-alpha-trypsin inhibitor heavy chain H4-like isoform X2 [Colias croceus]|uniref:inter-alpha-trypsin inhibitor heavy chain H4-like isoform X2 n=1 Tax=Colias crocea TaxID=72248 RepID=UPI001E27F2A6|nr:inter-alpha-trypsin inhibitor heavy chain H4-like isoform X2 [Colias croceus]
MRRKSTLLCLAALIAAVTSAAVSTQETLVIARSEDENTTPTELISEEPTTEEPIVPIKLTEMRVHSEIALRYAHTSVVTTVRNRARRAQEAFFRMLLPETAFISGFVMTLDGKSYKAYVKEKEEAKQIYNEAVSQGFGAAHISAKARDSNHFMVSVNVEANTTAVFNLTYEELLVRRNGVYNHDINLHPGALVPKMKVTVHIRETEKITKLRVPEVRTGNEIDATEQDAQNPIALIDRAHDDREATITFKPNLEEQKRLMEIYSAKSKESASNRPYYYGRRPEEEKKEEGTIGQFVVQYDVDRSKNGEVLVNDGYFVHFLAPSSLPPLKKHAVFVLDTSGSMMGRKIEQLREAMQTILDKLNPGDYFSIIEFNSNVVVHSLQEVLQPKNESHTYYNYRYEPPTLVPPSEATVENIIKAKVIVSRLQSYGGTNINSALSVAIDLIRKGVNWEVKENTTEVAATTVSPTTTVSEEKAADDPVDTDKNDLEPIIIFLTDGDPTEGETNTARILTHLSEKNFGEKKASIFSLAFGEDADRSFLRKLSLKNEGFMRHIYEAADAALQLRDFYQQVSSPLLSNVKFTYPKDQIKEGSLTRSKFRAVYDGSEVVVAGRVAEDVSEIDTHIIGICGVSDGPSRKKYEIMHKIPVSRGKNEYMPLERLWAYLTIKQLLDEKEISDADIKAENTPEKKALQIALKYEFVTPLTSLVVVKPNATKSAVNAESVDLKPSFDFADNNGPQNSIIPLSGHFMSSLTLSRPASYQSLYGPPAPSFQAVADAFEEEDLDYGMAPFSLNSHRSDFFGYPMPQQSIAERFEYASTTFSTPPLSPLNQYNLDEYPWAQDLINVTTDMLELMVNGTQVNLKITKASLVPTTSGGDAQCGKSTDASTGVCVYVTRCRSAKPISSVQYAELYCIVGDGYAGVCCPSGEVDKIGSN